MLTLLLLACSGTDGATTDSAPPRAVDLTDLIVPPYLQAPTPTTQWVLWISDTDTESAIEWGYTPELGHTATGTVDTDGLGLVHSVQLTDLTPDSRVHYRVATDTTVSELASFRTAPLAGSETSFVLVAMSDMQRSDSWIGKFEEIVRDGVLPHVAETWPTQELPDTVAAVLVTGDLVDNGWFYQEWWDDFFLPASPLLQHVNVLPVLGNHEANTPLFFRYFRLPDNGTEGYEGHWWWVDHDSVRIIGLDSNDGYREQVQLDWLSTTLDDACDDPDLDFVVAQIHHPHESELWPSGNLDYTGDVIALLEAFTETCGKPSVHLFGHTHGYSRGQSRDQRHLMVNVASAGGALDPWDDGSINYESFSVSESDWGFVTLEITGGDDPSLELVRLSRGDGTEILDNVERDRVRVRLHDLAPETPTALSSGTELVASDFSDPDGDLHGASHWQVAHSCERWDDPVFDHWQQHQDRFGGEDLAAGVDLTRQAVTGLAAGTDHCWRVRYRDRGLSWSEWSAPESFRTAE
jgi:hypothetical protein